jgi:tetratricopeptide (TPR) repeat protein
LHYESAKIGPIINTIAVVIHTYGVFHGLSGVPYLLCIFDTWWRYTLPKQLSFTGGLMKRIMVAGFVCSALFAVGCSKGPSSEELVFRSELYADMNNIAKSEDWARKAVAADAANPDAWRALGNTWVRKNNVDSAIASFDKAVGASPDNIPALYALSNTLAAKGNADRALEVIRHAIEVKPDTSVGYNNEGVILTTKGQLEPAVASFKKAIELDAKNVQAHYNLGNVYVKMRKYDDATASFKKALGLNSTFTQCYLELANISGLQGRNDEMYNNQGLALLTQNNLGGAILAFENSVKLNPNYAIGHNNLAHTYLKANQREKAISEFKAAARLGYADAQRLLAQEKIDWNK